KDKNVHDAINKAVEKATGKYIAIMSSDDYYKDKDIVEDVVVNYLEKEQADYSFGDEERISVKDDSFVSIWKGDAYMFEFWRGVSFGTEAILFKKEIFEKVGCFDVKYPVAADLKLQMKIRFGDYKGVYNKRIVNVFREGNGESSRTSTVFIHKIEFAEICHELWSQFDNTLTLDRVEYMIKYNDYSELFLMKLRKFVLNKKLKNLDYVGFNEYIEKMINFYNSCNVRMKDYLATARYIADNLGINYLNKEPAKQNIFLFGFIPILKILSNSNKVKVFLFAFIPILTIKKKKNAKKF
ncbi:MAG: glycosyltransferase, partial [Rickettsiales bacterium]|nr:glycosyltransferase [Rickettsiales bacterium]